MKKKVLEEKVVLMGEDDDYEDDFDDDYEDDEDSEEGNGEDDSEYACGCC